MKTSIVTMLSALILLTSGTCFADLLHKVIVYEFVEDYWEPESGQMERRISCNDIPLASYKPNPGESDDQLIARLVKAYNVTLHWVMVDDHNLPAYVFKSAWRIAGDKVTADLRKVKQMRMNQIRYARNSLLLESDIALLRALEREDKTELANIKAWRQALRDIPQKFDMSLYRTPEEIFNFAVPPEIPLEKLNQFVFSL